MSDLTTSESQGQPPRPFLLRGLTLRALICGTFFSLFLSLAAPYVNMVCGGAVAANMTPVGAIFLFTVVVAVFNMLMRGLDNLCGGDSFFGDFKLSAAELVVVLIMLLVVAAIPTYGFTESFVTILTGPAHYANDTNYWSEKVLPHTLPSNSFLPDRVNYFLRPVPFDPRPLIGVTKGIRDLEPDHIKWLYEGMPGVSELSFVERVMAIPWGPWIRPFAIWLVFIFTLYFVLMCIVSLLRKQWIERERLQYPLVQLPMAMVEEADTRKGVPALFRSYLLWIGFALPMLLTSWNQLAQYYQLVTPIPTSKTLYFMNNQLNLGIELNWPVIGFTYLVKLEVALSLWVFCLVGAFVGAAFSNLGVKTGSTDMWMWRGQEHPLVYHACMGGVIFLGLITLWSARRSIGEAVRKAFGAGEDVDDSNELIPHRVAFWGLVIGLTVMVTWMSVVTGMDLWYAPIYVVVALLAILAGTRLIAEGGLIFVQFPVLLPSFMFRLFSQSLLGPANLVGMSWTGAWVGDIRVMMMPALAHATKLADHVKLKQRRLIWLFLIAIVFGIVFSAFAVLYIGYTVGGAKADSWIFGAVGRDWFGRVGAENIPTAEQLRDGQQAGEEYSRLRVYATLTGGLIMVVLTVMRAWFLWWPFHPLGFPFAIFPAMQRFWLSVAIGWLLKMVILRYGGAVLFRKLKPFFYGLILGQLVTAGAWYVFYFFYVTWFQGAGARIYY